MYFYYDDFTDNDDFPTEDTFYYDIISKYNLLVGRIKEIYSCLQKTKDKQMVNIILDNNSLVMSY